jgi:hypothetical protein
MGRTTRILAAAIAIAVILALTVIFWPAAAYSHALDLPASVAFGVCAFIWVKAHANARQVEPPPGVALLAGFIFPVGVPVYLFRALGFRRGLWATLKAAGFMVAVVLVYVSVVYLGALLVYGTLGEKAR